MAEKMTRLVVTVPAEMARKLKAKATAEDRSASSIVRAALKAHLEGGRKAR